MANWIEPYDEEDICPCCDEVILPDEDVECECCGRFVHSECATQEGSSSIDMEPGRVMCSICTELEDPFIDERL